MDESLRAQVQFCLNEQYCNLSLPAVWQFRTERRGYEMILAVDLLGGFFLQRRWWGLTNRRGGAKRHQFLDLAQAWTFAQTVARRRHNHGYTALRQPVLDEALMPEAAPSTSTYIVSAARLLKKQAAPQSAAGPLKEKEAQLSLL